MIVRMSAWIGVILVIGHYDGTHAEFNVGFDDDHTRFDHSQGIPDPVVVSININGEKIYPPPANPAS